MIRVSTVAATSVGSGPDCPGLNAGSARPLLCGLGQVAYPPCASLSSIKDLGSDLCQTLQKSYVSSNYLFSFLELATCCFAK